VVQKGFSDIPATTYARGLMKPLPRMAQIFANPFENSRELAKLAAGLLVGDSLPYKCRCEEGLCFSRRSNLPFSSVILAKGGCRAAKN
jgi:hypothetical protein